MHRGLILGKLSREEEAFACHNAAIALEPGLAAAHTNHGVALRKRGDLRSALASLDTALALSHPYPSSVVRSRPSGNRRGQGRPSGCSSSSGTAATARAIAVAAIATAATVCAVRLLPRLRPCSSSGYPAAR